MLIQHAELKPCRPKP